MRFTDFYANESRTRFVCELSADHLSFGLLLQCSPQMLGQNGGRVKGIWRPGERAKVCGGQAPLCSAASAENNMQKKKNNKKTHIFFLFRLQPTSQSTYHTVLHTRAVFNLQNGIKHNKLRAESVCMDSRF